MSENTNVGRVFNLTGGGKNEFEANEIAYDNSTSGLTADDVQAAIDEMNDAIGDVNDAVDDKLDAPSGGTAGQVLTKTATGTEWADVSGGSTLALDRIYIDTQPTKTAYKAGETFAPAGMVVKADYALDGVVIVEGRVITGYSYPVTALAAGTTSITITLTENGVTKTATVSVSVTKTAVTIPTFTQVLTYNTNTQTPTFDNEDSTLMTKSGDTTGLNAGDYTAIFSLNDSDLYEWSDGTTSSKSVNWSIGKATNSASASPSSITLNSSNTDASFIVSRNGNGVITAESSDTSIVAIGTINQTTGEVPISSVNDTSGNVTITVHIAAGDNYSACSDITVSVVASFREYLYGFDLAETDSNPDTRVSYPSGVDNVGFTAAKMTFGGSFSYGSWPSTPGQKFMPRPCMLKYDGTVDYYLNPNDYTKKADGTASDIANTSYGGNAMMEWPKIYVKRWSENGVYHFRCSDVKVDSDYECYSNYDKNNNEIDHFYTPIYFGSKDSSNRLRSLSGQSNSVSTTAQNEIDYAKANGSDIWYTEVAADIFLEQDLLVLMFKSTNLQTALGHGRVKSSNSSAINTGTMNDKGLFWGSNDQTSGVKAFGMENPWGNLWRRFAGWILVDRRHKVKLTRGTKDGSTVSDYNTDGSGYIDTGVDAPSSNNYISAMAVKNYGRLPTAVAGSSTTYECDYFYQNTGTRYAVVGGGWNNGLSAGPFCVNLSLGASNTSTYVGAALSCKPLAAA